MHAILRSLKSSKMPVVIDQIGFIKYLYKTYKISETTVAFTSISVVVSPNILVKSEVENIFVIVYLLLAFYANTL